MALENKFGITDSAELARVEEKISKTKAIELFESGLLDTFAVGSFEGLSTINKYLFDEIYDFAEKMREVNMKGIDASYHYEGYNTFSTDELAK